MTRLRTLCNRVLSAWLTVPAPLRLLVPFGVMTALWVSSAMPPSRRDSGLLRAIAHNAAHVVAYAGLAAGWMSTFLACRTSELPKVPRWAATISVLLSFSYGIVDEVHQSFVPGRVCSLWDVSSDACGAAIGATCIHWSATGEEPLARRILGLVLAGLLAIAAATWLPA